MYFTCTNLDMSNVTRWMQINTNTIMKWVFMHRSYMHVFMAGQISYGTQYNASQIPMQLWWVHLRGLWLEGISSMVTAIPLRSSYLITLMLTVTTFTMYIQLCVYWQGWERIQGNTIAGRKSLENHSHFMGLYCMTSVQLLYFASLVIYNSQ